MFCTCMERPGLAANAQPSPCPPAPASLLLITVLIPLLMMGSDAASKQRQSQETYLLPILRYGPSNQKRDLRQLAAIAKQLDIGFLLTGIFQHYADIQEVREAEEAARLIRRAEKERRRAERRARKAARLKKKSGHSGSSTTVPKHKTQLEATAALFSKPGQSPAVPPAPCFKFPYRHFMPFDQVLDRSRLQSWMNVMSVEELKATGWDGTIDALMHKAGSSPLDGPLEMHINKTLRATNTQLSPSLVRIKVDSPVGCSQQAIQKLKAQVRQFRVVAVVLFVLNKADQVDYAWLAGRQPRQACPRDIYLAERMLRAAPWIQELARSYITHHLAGEPYLAVHVRPYPDTCLQGWKQAVLDDEYLRQQCNDGLRRLHVQLGPKVAGVMQHTGLRRLFVMAHPRIRDTINHLFAQVGIHPVWLTDMVLASLAGCTDNSSTFMAMAEEEIAVQAHTFIGTASSSITHSVAVGRMGNGSMKNLYLERLA